MTFTVRNFGKCEQKFKYANCSMVGKVQKSKKRGVLRKATYPLVILLKWILVFIFWYNIVYQTCTHQNFVYLWFPSWCKNMLIQGIRQVFKNAESALFARKNLNPVIFCNLMGVKHGFIWNPIEWNTNN